MRFFRASNLVLLSAIVLAIAAAILLSGQAQRDASDRSSGDVTANSKVLEAWLGQVLGLGYIFTGDEATLGAYEAAGDKIDVEIAALRGVTADSGEEVTAAVDAEVAAIRSFQRLTLEEINKRRDDPSVEVPGTATQLQLGLVINGVMNANREFGETVEATRKDAQGTARLVSLGSVGLLGLLIMALGITARRQDRHRRAHRAFGEALQAARTETEAYGLVSTHLQRVVDGSEVAVFNRNDSADRLEPSTRLAEESELGRALRGAKPDDCLAVRTAKVSQGGALSDDVLRCDICGELPGGSVCVPSIVGGEVIGSVLVRAKRIPGEGARRSIGEGVAEAAPVIAHLRSLAVAERQAGSDELTGLANKRAAEDTLTHFAANAARTGTPLTMVLFDLDHFKQVNDTLGHPKGDEVLAAVGAVTADHIRGEDFAARFGGEEFLVLLPGSNRGDGRAIAEKLRHSIGALSLPGVERHITASFGVAAMPADADGRDELVRMADRALYAAKNGGRNRVEAPATNGDGSSVDPPVVTPRA